MKKLLFTFLAMAMMFSFGVVAVNAEDGVKLPGDVGTVTGEVRIGKYFDITHSSRALDFDIIDTFTAESPRSQFMGRIDAVAHFNGFDVPFRYEAISGKSPNTGKIVLQSHDIEVGVDIALGKNFFVGPMYRGTFERQEIVGRIVDKETGTVSQKVESYYLPNHRVLVSATFKW